MIAGEDKYEGEDESVQTGFAVQSPEQFWTMAPHRVQISLHLQNSVWPPQAGHGMAVWVPPLPALGFSLTGVLLRPARV
ncbi:MAG: hypothetical protein AUH92_00150 [Acidobacteria bacterium 13_1_40CM_4_69_4]|nr:MAG: hypothetical protein AUH92_00150 [Acidobacteria bacterium 13_1_40CM_4_69_4]